MLVGYARVSTDQQSTDGQIDSLTTAGCERVFVRLDRLARSMRQLLTTVDSLEACGMGLRSLHENMDTTSATGRLIFHIFASLGQFEVELLRERTRSALAASRARGRIGGRPPALDQIKVTAARAMLASGNLTAAEVARQLGCAPSTLYRHVPGGRTGVAASADTLAEAA
jgi:DNA invertase Pin-like site-specific DNA recombinase